LAFGIYDFFFVLEFSTKGITKSNFSTKCLGISKVETVDRSNPLNLPLYHVYDENNLSYNPPLYIMQKLKVKFEILNISIKKNLIFLGMNFLRQKIFFLLKHLLCKGAS